MDDARWLGGPLSGRSEATSGNDETWRMRALVRGRVQGVFFRYFTRGQATGLGLGGTVRNMPDGSSVEVVAEGPRGALDELLERLRKGPQGAQVHDVEVQWGPASSEFGSFEVRG